ncbi:MAG: tRNA (adenosine(37)-N6)-threonylcarbamoyltransferase complex ATPase subunit type 1 TsaE [Bdellovibrionaceae bacterium]|nr:tRNA (adenosine(37)-N6)-threonylcarbamoyltransferase complex ATPase subunit type 1 TsaE [Pseudobdellovibrionaceae bacterium]
MIPLFTRQIQDVAELEPFVKDLWSLRSQKTVWLLQGDVGAGKTETVKTLAKVLQMAEVASPSFAVHHRYLTAEDFPIEHLDLYRLESEDDLESTGFWDLFSEPEGLIIIEWADRLNVQYLPRDWTLFRLEYKVVGETQREIRVETQAAL